MLLFLLSYQILQPVPVPVVSEIVSEESLSPRLPYFTALVHLWSQ